MEIPEQSWTDGKKLWQLLGLFLISRIRQGNVLIILILLIEGMVKKWEQSWAVSPILSFLQKEPWSVPWDSPLIHRLLLGHLAYLAERPKMSKVCGWWSESGACRLSTLIKKTSNWLPHWLISAFWCILNYIVIICHDLISFAYNDIIICMSYIFIDQNISFSISKKSPRQGADVPLFFGLS